MVSRRMLIVPSQYQLRSLRVFSLIRPPTFTFCTNNLLCYVGSKSTDLPYVGIDRQEPQAALEALDVFFKSGDTQIDHMIRVFLSRLHIYFPHEEMVVSGP